MKFTNALGGCANCGALTRSVHASEAAQANAHDSYLFLPSPPDVHLCIAVLAGGRVLTMPSTSAMLAAAGKDYMPDTYTGFADDNRHIDVHGLSSTVMAMDKI